MTMYDLPLAGSGPQRNGVFARGALDELPQYVKETGAQRVLLITGRASFDNSGANRLVDQFDGRVQTRRWSDFEPDVGSADLLDGIGIANEFAPDLIIAIGGGSVMDMAKLVCAFDGRATRGELESEIRSGDAGQRGRGLVLVPTTAGSGSESTHFAVVYIGEQKFSIGDASLLPDYVILDPDLTLSGSAYQKATSAVDALAQAIESYWATGATDESMAFSRHALAELVPALGDFVAGSHHAAASMAAGSHLAGRAIDISKTTGPHALSYGLTKGYGVSHGHAVLTTFAAFARAHASGHYSLQPKLDETEFTGRLDDIAVALGAADRWSIAEHVSGIATDAGLTLRLRDLEVPYSGLDALTESVNVERLSNNPVQLSQNDLYELLAESW